MALRFKNPPPANPDDFERLCLRLLKAHWNLPDLELYGRRGERQHGVDIIDMSGAEALRAAQCKLYDPSGTLPPAEIQAEVDAAKGFPFPLAVYAICTTARVSTQAQNAILSINQEHRQRGLFAVELFTWDRLDELLEEFTTIRDQVYGTLSGEVAQQVQSGLSEIKLQLTDLGTQVVSTTQEAADGLHQEIDEARDLVRSGQAQTARLLLQRLRTRKWEQMGPRHRYRVLANIGAAYLAERDFPQAAQLFLEAAAFQPEDSQAAENEALAYFISKPTDKAFGAITNKRLLDYDRPTYGNANPNRAAANRCRPCDATRHLQDGIDIRTLQQWMGHRDILSTMVYLKGLRNSDVQARINKGSLAAFA